MVAARRGGGRLPARVPEPPRRGCDHRKPVLSEEPVRVARRPGALEVRLAPAEAVEQEDRRERAVAGRGKRHVDVDRGAVEARRPRREIGGGAEAHAVLRRAGVAEGRGVGDRRGGSQCECHGDRRHGQEASHQAEPTPRVSLPRARERSGEKLSSFGRPGHMAGNFKWVHNMAIDSKGTICTAEVGDGRRVQKFKRTN